MLMTLRRRARVLLLTSAALASCTSSVASAAPPGTNVLVSRPSAFGPLATPTTNDSAVSLGEEGGSRVVSDEDGHRYVVFVSQADGLSADDDDRFTNVYVRDRTLNITTLVSRADGPAGAGGNGSSAEPSISADGRWVAFQSAATNLVLGVTEGVEHVYVRDLLSGTTRLVDRADGDGGAIADDDSFDPSIAVLGGQPVVAFSSVADNLSGATGGFAQVYVRQESLDDTTMVSRRDGSLANPNAAGNGSSSNPSISTDGAVVAFESAATNLVAVDANMTVVDVFTRTRSVTLTRIASAPGTGDSRNPSISSDGNEVAFTSTSDDLHGDDTTTDEDVYVRRFAPPALEVASRSSGGVKGNEPSSQPSITDSGNAVVYSSASDNLTAGDTNATTDVFLSAGVFNATPTTSIVSNPAESIQSDGPSSNPSISRNLTNNTNLIVFQTAADNMGADDENDFSQVYVRLSGIVLSPNAATYVSRATGTDPFRSGVNASFLRSPLRSDENVASMSQDGRFTVFLSLEDDLSADDDDRFVNVYRRDNLTGETALVSRADGPAGAAANGTSGTTGGGLLVSSGAPSGAPSISADGNRIAFASAATNLVGDDTNALPDVFVRDLAAGTTTLASRDDADAVMTLPSGDPAISGDGAKVAFVTRFAGDPMDGNSDPDVYLRDLGAGTTALISRKGAAGPSGNDGSGSPAIDADGDHVAFATSADDFSALLDANMSPDVWVRDVGAGQVSPVSVNVAGNATGNDSSLAPAISADGNRVAFSSSASNLVGGVDFNGGIQDVFVRDMTAATTTLVSRTAGANGISGNNASDRVSIDASGTRIVFETFANDLVPGGDVNGSPDVLLRDTVANTTELVSRAPGIAGAQAAESSGSAAISGNGDCVAFQTTADEFVAMPPGTDHQRVVARAVRGDCPFGPLPGPPAPPGPPGPPATPPDTTAPVLSGVSIAPRRFLPGRRVRPRTRKRPPIGARIRFTLSEAATVTIRIDALLPGRRLGKRCVRPRRAPRGRKCRRAVGRGALTRAGGAGANRSRSPAACAAGAPAGPYRATLRARDAAGNASAPKPGRVHRVLRPR